MTRIMVRAFFGGLLAIMALVSQASAASQTFNNPTQGPNRLDWCYNWGVGCGQQAANAWCVTRGYQNATNFAIANDIGGSSPTRLIGTGAVCDQGFCDGFSYITCYKPDPTVTYNAPTFNGNRLDWCENWGTGCGQQAANRYCVTRGHVAATGFAIANDIGASTPTRLIATGAVCDQGFCDGFAYITCQN
jgi:hypothetical protein